MFRQPAVRIFVAVPLLIFLLPMVCLALPSTESGLSGHCRGHHHPNSSTSHSCCYAVPQPTSPVDISPTSSVERLETAISDAPLIDLHSAHLPVSFVEVDVSPPAPVVLRI